MISEQSAMVHDRLMSQHPLSHELEIEWLSVLAKQALWSKQMSKWCKRTREWTSNLPGVLTFGFLVVLDHSSEQSIRLVGLIGKDPLLEKNPDLWSYWKGPSNWCRSFLRLFLNSNLSNIDLCFKTQFLFKYVLAPQWKGVSLYPSVINEYPRYVIFERNY